MNLLSRNFKKIALSVVVLLALLLRLININSYPVGFNADEASFGYDAFSIIHTGRDQWGNFMPLVLKSFGDYKSPLYSYIAVPFVWVLGLTKLAVRLPNPVVGALAVVAVYLLTNEILKKYKKELSLDNIEWQAIVAAFLLAINPWHVMMSRGAFEANLVTLFIPLGLYFFFKALEKSKFFVWSAIFFGLSFFTYHSAKLITPTIGIGLLVMYWKEIVKIGFKKLKTAILVFSIFLIGLIYTFLIGGGSRISERSITNGALEEGAKEKIALIQAGGNPTVTKILHNKYQVILQRFTSNYAQYFSYRFLFSNGAGEATYGMIPGIPVLYIFDGLILLGLVPLLIYKKKMLTIVLAVAVWLLISALPAALTTGVGYAGNRAEGMLPAIQILEAFGFIGWIAVIKKLDRKMVYLISAAFSIFIIFQVKDFCKLYFAPQPEAVEKGMLVNDLQLGQWLNNNAKGEKAIISRSLSEPQIFVAFGTKMDPNVFQKSTSRWGFDGSDLEWVDQLPEYNVGAYTIKSLDWGVDGADGETLIVGSGPEFQQNLVPIKIFNYSDGNMAIFVTRNIKSI